MWKRVTVVSWNIVVLEALMQADAALLERDRARCGAAFLWCNAGGC